MEALVRVRSRLTPGESAQRELWFLYANNTETMTDDVTSPYVNKVCTHTQGRLIGGHGRFGWFVWGGVVLWAFDGNYGVVNAAGSGDTNFTLDRQPHDDATASVLAKLNTEYCTKIREAGRSDFHCVSFLREISSTYSMLKSPVRALKHLSKLFGRSSSGTIVSKFKKLKRSGPNTKLRRKSRSVDAAADAWLQGTYGWQPFLYDMLALSGGIKRAMDERQAYLSGSHEAFSYYAQESSTKDDPPGYTRRRFQCFGSSQTRVRASLSGVWRPNPTLQNETALQCLIRACNIDRLGYAVWDAVPYSFVIDWFLPNVGDRLDDALSGPAFYMLVDHPYLALRREVTLNAQVMGTPGIGAGSGSQTEIWKAFSRGPCVIEDLDLTDYRQGMQGTRIPSGLALAFGAFRRR